MKRHPKLLAGVVFLAASSVTLFGGWAFASKVGAWTNSGPFGICGPYGEHGGLVLSLVLGSVPASFVVGIFLARRCYRHFSR